jgi:ankyrin repeat protein
VIEKLLLKGAYINAADKCFHTALMYACMQGSESYIISLLLSHGADSTLVNIDNKKAVDFLSSEELKSFFQSESLASMATLVRLGRVEAPEWVRRINNKELLMPAQR